MGSMSNPNSWAPYDSYTDCSRGICNFYCPQWCYLIFPPPPPVSFLDDEDDPSSSSSSSSNFSPLLIALIGILVGAFALVSYYTVISKYCHRRHESSSEAPGHDHGGVISSATESRHATAARDGLNDSLIKSITVYKYRKGDGFVDGSDCSVCLSEFEENESLRLLPKCNHAFHLPCIDTWLKSHSNCPLCRAFVTGVNPTTEAGSVANQTSSPHQIATESGNHSGGTTEINSTMGGYQHQTGDSVVVIEDLEIGRSQSEPPETEDDERDKVSAGVGTSQQRPEEGEEDEHGDGETPPPTEAETAANQISGVSSFLPRSSVAMKRSVSTGRFIFSRYDQSRNHNLPN